MSMFTVKSRTPSRSSVALLLLLLAVPGVALAATGALPYETGLKNLTDSMTGPVAFGISVIGVVAAGAALIFGGDMSGFMRSMVFVVLVIGVMVSATAVLTKIFGLSAPTALIAPLASQGLC